MKRLCHLILFFSQIGFLNAQSFTKIAEGPHVTDGGESFGVAWADLNNDGFSDLFISNGGASGKNADNFLYMNNGDGTFSALQEGQIVNGNSRSNGATIADYNNDGLDDIAVANRDNQNNFLYLNHGNFQFQQIADNAIVTDGGNSNSAGWTDFDNNGYIDLFVTNFFAPSFLYSNNVGTFSKMNEGHPTKETNTSIGCAWSDFDNDGDSDLMVTNAGSAGKTNLFYINRGDGSFSKLDSGAITTDKRASMGATWGDFNNDGRQDLFVANQANFVNDLYVNNGDGSLTPIRSGEVVNENSMSISGSFIDFDNDGDLDLFVSNWSDNKNFLYENSGYPDYAFNKLSDGAIVNDVENSMASAWADYDNDGDLDLFVANRGGNNNTLYRNETIGNNWIQIKHYGRQSNASAIGTKIRLKAAINDRPVWQMREINAQHGYNSQNDNRVHFGLGAATQIDSIIVEWPSGLKQTFTAVEANDFYILEEGGLLTRAVTSIEQSKTVLPQGFSLRQNWPNPFNPSTTIELTIPESAGKHIKLQLDVFNLNGQKVATLFDGFKSAGTHRFVFNAVNLPSGIYFYRVSADGLTFSKKMVLTK